MKISARYKGLPSNFRRYISDLPEMPQVNNDLYTPHGSYQAQLFDQRWKNKRALILQRDRHQCKNCGSDKELEVHHRQYHFIASSNTYKEPWDYSSDLLVTLCRTCNQKGRNKFKIPTKIV